MDSTKICKRLDELEREVTQLQRIVARASVLGLAIWAIHLVVTLCVG